MVSMLVLMSVLMSSNRIESDQAMKINDVGERGIDVM